MRAALLAALLALLLPLAAASGGGGVECVSKDEWPKFELHGKQPRSQSGLTYCSRWRDFTCCDETQVNKARNLYSTMDLALTTKPCREVSDASPTPSLAHTDASPRPPRSQPSHWLRRAT